MRGTLSGGAGGILTFIDVLSASILRRNFNGFEEDEDEDEEGMSEYGSDTVCGSE